MSMVKFMKRSPNQHKVDITRRLYLNGVLFNVLTSTEFRAIQKKHYDNYIVLIRIKFNDNVTHDYQRFFIVCAEKPTRGIQQHHGEPFIHVMYAMLTLDDMNS